MTRHGIGAGFDVGSDEAVVAAESAGVCIRPHVRRVTDMVSGWTTAVPIPCGSTREVVCKPCAVKARRLRMHQCREGWHLAVDPAPGVPEQRSQEELVGENEDDDAERSAEVDLERGSGRKVRSTRRLEGIPELPTVPMDQRTTGRGYVDEKTGRIYHPSMFITLTLPSYGKVIPGTGTPVDPGRYDYRRAALDALLFPRLLDRFWQNLRRCAGYKVQYFSAIEAQRRLAPHLHAAVRGAISRATVKAVTRGTYHAAWWPSLDRVVYEGPALPVWDELAQQYVDPDTGVGLPSWDQAIGDLDEPAHVVHFGAQVDIKGLLGGTEDSDRAVRYLCKYVTKNVADTYAGQPSTGVGFAAYERHICRLHDEVRWMPCSPGCSNWLRYGVQPRDARPGLVPGQCSSSAHDRENLGLGGRRVLVSRQWSGKTLTEHRADRRRIVAEVLAAAGIDPLDAARLAADQLLPDGSPRFVWQDVDVRDVDYVAVIAASLRQARLWREQYEHAKILAAQCGSPPVDSRSAITSTAAADAA